ncbi:MAG: ABC transporter ATP-binding protein [Proteobacteria bacterium]|nr:ABC transporter ATP-binding protein [Pseudomonadota bacterium]
MSEPLVKIENLHKSFYRDKIEIKVLENINLEVESGEFVGLMGPSGSGKTTLLNIISALDSPTSGSVLVDGKDISNLNEKHLGNWRNRNIGFIFQLYNLMPVLTAYENVELPLLLSNLSSKERKEHVETSLRIVGLEDRMEHYPRQLSGGQEQRVAIARAFVSDPKIILADEPTGDLDSQSAKEILNLMKMLNEKFNKTIIMVTHDPEAEGYAKRRLRLLKGELIDG